MQRAPYPHLFFLFATIILILGSSFTWASSNDFYENGAHVTRSPMPGRVITIFVKKGQKIYKGDKLFCIEAMKMEHICSSEFSGKVDDIFCQVDDCIESDAPIISILSIMGTQTSNLPTQQPFQPQFPIEAYTPKNHLSKITVEEPLRKSAPATEAKQEIVKKMIDVCFPNIVTKTVPQVAGAPANPQAPTTLLTRVSPELSKPIPHMQQFVLPQEIVAHDNPLQKLLLQAPDLSFAPALEQKNLPSLTLVSSNYARNIFVEKLTYVLGMARLSAKDQPLLRRIPHLTTASNHTPVHLHIQQSLYADALLLLALILTLLTSAYALLQLLRRPTHLPASSETQLPTYVAIYLPPRFSMWR